MSSSGDKLFCEVIFRDFRTNKILGVTGKTTVDNLISSKKKFILIENMIFQKQKWETYHAKVPKVDIIKIVAYKSQIFLNYDKGALIINKKNIKNNQDQYKNKYKSANIII